MAEESPNPNPGPGPSRGGPNAGPNTTAQNDAAEAQVNRIAVKLAKFWPDKASLWFVQAEAQFTLINLPILAFLW